jgi:hypothetical protein
MSNLPQVELLAVLVFILLLKVTISTNTNEIVLAIGEPKIQSTIDTGYDVSMVEIKPKGYYYNKKFYNTGDVKVMVEDMKSEGITDVGLHSLEEILKNIKILNSQLSERDIRLRI